MSKKINFKTETKRLLDLMIHSIYTHKEIFIRELISNASDAIDKRHYNSLTDKKGKKEEEFEIRLSVDKDNRMVKISDNGIGMTLEEIKKNIGTIAKSGSLEFLEKLDDKKDVDIIGQFGVGFYSAFMVASKVVLDTKSADSETGYRFTSTGEDSYTIDEIEKDTIGTEITLFLRENTKEEDYDDYLNDYKIQSLVKKYSDYVRYPIKMQITKTTPVYDDKGEVVEGKTDTTVTDETLNSMLPLWKRNKKEVKDKDLNDFYKSKFYDYEDPMLNLFLNIEGNITYNALVYIPKNAPHNMYSDKYEKGLQLYTKGVFIMDKCKELVPDYLRFIKGLVDSSDLSLNISRETLQQNAVLNKISQNIEKRLLKELEKIKKNDFSKYKEFFKTYGVNLKYGIYDQFGAKKDSIKDLLIYNTINSDEMISLKQYVDSMPKEQEVIYYASGKTKEAVLSMPQLDLIKKKGYDCLILTDDIDEFAINILMEYDKKKFSAINQGEIDVLTDDEKKQLEKLSLDKKELLEKIKKQLEGKVDDVILSKRLTDSPVCLVSGEGVSFEMEKVLADNPANKDVKAKRILELNPNHELFKALEKANDKTLETYAYVIYNQALLIEGIKIDDPVTFSNKMCELMINAKIDE